MGRRSDARVFPKITASSQDRPCARFILQFDRTAAFDIEIERLLEHMHPLLYLPGDCILQCRTHATRLVLLQEGHAEVVSSTATNVATMGPGAVCGASAFFRDSDNVLYCQSVLALTRVVAMALSKEAWHKIASSTERAAASDHAEMLMKGRKRAEAVQNLRRPKLAGLNTVPKRKGAPR